MFLRAFLRIAPAVPVLFALRAYAAAGDAAPAAAAPAAAPANPVEVRDPLADARALLANRDFDGALRLLDGHLQRKDAPAEETAYLKGNTLALAKKWPQAIAVLEELVREHPKGEWRRKALFKIADCWVGQTPPDYAKAAAILESQVTELTGPARKAEIAAVYLKFADEAFAPTAKDATGRPVPPRYPEAKRFYELAAEVGLTADAAERVEFRLAVCEQRSGQQWESIARAKRYLKDRAKNGRFLNEAAYLLGEANFAVGQASEARVAWRDLAAGRYAVPADAPAEQVKAIAELKALALYRVSRTFDSGDKEGYGAYVKSLEEFAKGFPDHKLVPQARYEIALAAFSRGRHEDAATAFSRFIADHQRAGDVEYIALDRLIAVNQGQPDAVPANRQYLMPLARNNLGHALAAQKKYAEAIEVWQGFLAKHSGDALWTSVQQAIVDTEFAVGADRLAAKEPKEARTAWEKFIAKYPLDGRVPGLYYTFGQINFDDRKYDDALADWRLLAGKFPGTEEAGRAQYRVGLTLEIQLNKPAEALDEYRRLNWSNWAARAQQRMQLMTQRELTVASERSFRTDEKPVVKVFTRNIEKLQVRVYRLDLASFFRKQHTVLGVEYLDLALIAPSHKFEHAVKDYAKYRPVEDGIEIPLDGAGVAAVTVADEQFQATTLVIRSDLDVLIKSSRDETFVFAQNMRTGEPFAGAEILASDGKEVRSAGRTGADGVLRIKDKKLCAAGSVAVFATAAGHVAANAVSLQGLQAAEGLAAKGHLYTDRPAYRPGQTVNVRAVIREVKDGSYSFTPGDTWSCDISDPEGRLLRSERLKLSDFGTVHTKFLLDEFAPLGAYRIVVRKENGPVFAGGFTVARYQLPKLQLKFELPEAVYFRGELVKGKISARYYYGEPVVGKTVVYSLGNGQNQTAVTDANGEIDFEIDTKQFNETQTVPLAATVADENVSVNDSLTISTQGFGISLATVRDVYLTEEKFDVAATTLDARGKPIGEKLKVTLLRRENAAAGGWRGDDGGEVAVMTRDLETDAKTGKGTVNLTAAKGGWHIVRVEGTDRFGNPIGRDKAVFISGDDDATKLRIISETQTFKVGEKPAVKVHSRTAKRLALVTYEGEGILDYELVTLLPGMNTIRPNVDHRYFPNFSMSVQVMEPKKLHQARFEFSVERELRIALKPARTVLQPGEPLEVEIVVTDQNSRPVSAELGLSLTDASLIALFGDPSGELKAVFGGSRRQAYLRTTASTVFAYAPATVPISKLVTEEGERIDTKKQVAVQIKKLQAELRAQAREVRGKGDVQRLAALAQQFNQNTAILDNDGEARTSNPNAANWYLSVDVPKDVGELSVNRWANADDTRGDAGVVLQLGEEKSLDDAIGGEKLEKAQKDNLGRALGEFDSENERLADGKGQGQAWGAMAGKHANRRDISGLVSRTEPAKDAAPSDKPATTAAPRNPVPEAKAPEAPVALGAVAFGGEGGRGAGGGGGRVSRDYFPETGYWNPAVVTDKNGAAKLEIRLPDSITRWKLSARGVTADTVVGDADVEITARKDFFVELKVPTILHAGDKVRAAVRVHHLADLKDGMKDRTVKVSLVVQQGRKRQEEVKTLLFAGKEIREIEFEPRTAEGLETAFSLTAVSDDGLRDGMAKTLPVRPDGTRFVAHDSATTRNSAVSLLELPAGRQYGQLRMNIVVGPSLVRTLVDMALNTQPRLSGEGWGGWDRAPSDGAGSAAGDLLAVVFVTNYLKNTAAGAGPDLVELEARLAQLTAALTVSQTKDGGWSWSGAGGAVDPFLSARVLWALAAARDAGRPVDTRTIERARGYLQGEFARAAESDHQTKAVLLHALSEADPAGDWFTQANRLYRLRNALNTASLASLSLTLSNLGRKETAAEINALLSAKKRVVADVAGPAKAFWPSAGSHAWLSADVEVTALAVMALQRVNPRDEAVEPAVRWLTAQRQGLRVRPDKATGLVVATLGRFHGDSKAAAEKYRLAVVVNGREVGRAEVDGHAQSLRFEVPPEAVQPGRNKVEFNLDGNAEYNYAVTLTGWGQGEDIDLSGGRLFVQRRFEPAPLEHDGRTVPRGFSVLRGEFTTWTNPLSQLPLGKMGQVTLQPGRNTRDLAAADLDYVVLHEPLPAGCGVLPESITGGFERFEVGDGEITFFIGRRTSLPAIRYTLVGLTAGEYKAPPPVMTSVYRPGVMRIGVSKPLAVLPRDGKSADPYRMTPDELYHIGGRLFEEGKVAESRARLGKLFDEFNTPQFGLRDDVYRETARMLMRAAIDAKDNDAIVRFFEVMKERYADLVIPYDQVLVIGRAYVAKGEPERGMIVFRATADAGFVTEAQVAQVLQGQGRFEASVDFLRKLLLQYPDTASAKAAVFALSQLVYSTSKHIDRFADLKERKATKAELLGRAIALIREFLSLYPDHPAADEAGFSMAAALLELEDFKAAALLTETLLKRHPESPLTDQFLYMHAFAEYSLGEFERAIADGKKVAEGKFRNRSGALVPSENRWLATYIIGQIHHSRLDPAGAIASYEKVADRFADAKEAIEYFTRKDLSLDEVKTFVPAKAPAALPDGADLPACERAAKTVPHIRLSFRNVPEAEVKVYNVDLMKLYLLQRNLSGITGVNLTGITPTFTGTVKLGDGKDYADKTRYFWLPQIADKPGAYLVVVRGENIHRSGMVLVSNLTVEVQEDVASGRVRVNVRRPGDGAYAAKVHVKAIAPGNAKPEAGDTDLRGLFIADDLRGKITVLAQDEGEHYAFYRGTAALQGFDPAPRTQQEGKPAALSKGKSLKTGDYLDNVNRLNKSNLDRNSALFERDVFNNDKKGVQVQQAQ